MTITGLRASGRVCMFLIFVLALSPRSPSSELKALVSHLPRSGESCWVLGARGQTAWRPKVARLRGALEQGSRLDLADWKTILFDKGYLRWRDRWPAGEPFAVSLHVPPLAQGFSIELVPRGKDLRPALASHWEMMCGLGEDAQLEAESYQELGRLHAGKQTIEFDLVVNPELRCMSGPSATSSDRGDRWGPIAITVDVVAEFDEVLAPTDDPAITHALSAGLRVRPSYPDRLVGNFQFSQDRWPSDVALSLECVLKRDGREMTRRSIACRSEAGIKRSFELGWVAARETYVSKRAGHWTIELRGNRRGTLADWNATKYWSGSCCLSLRDALN